MKKLLLVLTGLICLTSLHSSLSLAAGEGGGASGNGNGKTVEMATFKKIEGAEMFHKALNLFDLVRGVPQFPSGVKIMLGEVFSFTADPDVGPTARKLNRQSVYFGVNVVNYGPLGQEIRENIFSSEDSREVIASNLTDAGANFAVLENINGTLTSHVSYGRREEVREIDGLILIKVSPNEKNECYGQQIVVDGACEMFIFRK